jgi:DNA-binding Lrp family transcriptional regulator
MPLAYVMVHTMPDKMEEVLEKIKEIDGIIDAYMVYGLYDIIAEIKVENPKELWATILNIRILKHIFSTITLSVIG